MHGDFEQLTAVPRNQMPAALERGFGGLLLRLWRALRQRRELRRLAEFDDRMLRDVGVTRGDVERALASPFWCDLDPECPARGPRWRS
jgi:uncharacterized protein YjiS (DUF1127 family)